MANGRRKGSVFERKVAALIAKHFGVSVKECYRTPLSGGHPYADRGDLTMSPELLKRFPYCFDGATIVQSPEGDISIKELTRRFNTGEIKRYPVYSVDLKTGNMALKWCTKAWKSGVKRVVAIQFDDGSTLRCTPEHILFKKTTKGGTSNSLKNIVEIPAGKLQPKDRVWAPVPHMLWGRWHMRKNMLHGRNFSNVQPVAVAYATLLHGPIRKSFDVHHKDENKLNDRASNLEVKHSGLHRSEHKSSLSPQAKENHIAGIRSWWEKLSTEERERIRKIRSKNGYNRIWTDKQRSQQAERIRLQRERGGINHEVVSVTVETKPVAVYDLTVEDFHTVLVGTGVLAHNCVEAKHTKAWKWTHLFSPTALMNGWAKQVLRSSSQCDRKPVIVFRGTGGPIFAATRPEAHWVHDYEKPVCIIHLAGKSWIVQPLEQWLLGLEVAGPKPVKKFFTYDKKSALG